MIISFTVHYIHYLAKSVHILHLPAGILQNFPCCVRGLNELNVIKTKIEKRHSARYSPLFVNATDCTRWSKPNPYTYEVIFFHIIDLQFAVLFSKNSLCSIERKINISCVCGFDSFFIKTDDENTNMWSLSHTYISPFSFPYTLRKHSSPF